MKKSLPWLILIITVWIPLDKNTAAMKVPGGWIIRTICYSNQDYNCGASSNFAVCVAQTFVADKDHHWSLK